MIRIRSVLLAFTLCMGGIAASVASCAAQTPAPVAPKVSPSVITDFDTPLLFTYGTWQDKATVNGSQLHLRGAGITPKGGGGSNAELNLQTVSDDSAVLRVKVGASNTLKSLRLLLRDQSGKSCAFTFTLPTASDQWVEIAPLDGASFGKPNSVEKEGMPDLSRVSQWQIQGDWGGDGPVDIDVDQIKVALPDALARAARDAREKQEQAEQVRVAQNQTAMRARYKPGVPSAPGITSVSLVAPDMVSVTIEAQAVVPSKMIAYAAQIGDEVKKDGGDTKLVRGGQEIGWLIGPKKDSLITFETLSGDPLNEFDLSEPGHYRFTSSDDAAFSSAVVPLTVYRKSKPLDWRQPSGEFAMRHCVYLKLARPLTPGKTYSVRVRDVNLQKPDVTFRFDPRTVRSEAVHVNQIGYRPDDPGKRAFLSIWLGTGGAYSWNKAPAFSLVNAQGQAMFRGTARLARRASEPDKLQRTENFAKTDVWQMDFGPLKTPGTYRVVVEGVGCSYPFGIGAATWDKAFRLTQRGLYNQRGGVDLKPPFADFTKPRDFHPADGAPVFDSTYTALDGPTEGVGIEKGSTGKLNPNAWGGYHDAGDWNPRRVTHLKVTEAQLELLEMFPAYFGAMRLPIPHTPTVPDVLTEALFEVDCFRRLQKPDGGVSFGIETNGDPLAGEVSWKQSMPAYVYGPDPQSSWFYAHAAGRAAKLLRRSQPTLARVYEQSAVRAMEWAEADLAKRNVAQTADKLPWEARDARNFAAVVLYDLTGKQKWHDLFKQTSALAKEPVNLFQWGDHVQRDAAFYYARLPKSRADATLQARAVEGLENQALLALGYAGRNTFNIATPDTGKPMIVGYFSGPDAVELARAHFLTGKAEYLTGAIQACQFSSGDNPANQTYTTGLGANPPRHPLHLDTRHTGQPAPTGLTVYGNFDAVGFDQQWATWPLKYYLNRVCTPPASEWPLQEQFFDIFLYPATNEFTVDAWTPNVFVWGYLAARK